MGFLPLPLRDSDSQPTPILDMKLSFQFFSVTGNTNEHTKLSPSLLRTTVKLQYFLHASCDFGIFTNVTHWLVLKTLLRWNYLKRGSKSLWRNLAFIYGLKILPLPSTIWIPPQNSPTTAARAPGTYPIVVSGNSPTASESARSGTRPIVVSGVVTYCRNEGIQIGATAP